jgi:hypothetical protein
MVLQDLGRRINAAVNDLTRSSNVDEKVRYDIHSDTVDADDYTYRLSMAWSRRFAML